MVPSRLSATGERAPVSGLLKRATIFRFLLAIGTFGWLYIIFFSDVFQVSRVEAIGVTSMDGVEVYREVLAELDKRSIPLVLKRHLFFIREQTLAEALRERFFAEQVAVEKVGFNVLRLIVEERSNRVIVHAGTQFYWVDLNGVILSELNLDDKKLALQRVLGQRAARPTDPPIFEFDQTDEISQGFKIAESQQIKDWIRFITQCTKQDINYRVFIPSKQALEPAKLINSEGTYILVDLGEPLQRQIEAYKEFMKNKPQKLRMSVIDVRIAGKVFVR